MDSTHTLDSPREALGPILEELSQLICLHGATSNVQRRLRVFIVGRKNEIPGFRPLHLEQRLLEKGARPDLSNLVIRFRGVKKLPALQAGLLCHACPSTGVSWSTCYILTSKD